MSGMNEQNQTSEGGPNESQKTVAFCQHCGKPLDHETKRVVGAAVYCEPCLAARLGGGTAYPGSGASQAYGPVNSVAGIPMPTGEPNPGLAALLGLIPGVGAMYNEQYAKGIVHLVIFAVLVSFSHVSGIFILFVFGWLAYMSIEAHHTAKARRDGTPLPNPFGFNDIGERMGFGKAWPGAPDMGAVARDAAQAAATGFGSIHTSFAAGSASNPVTGAAAPPPWTAAPDEAAAAGASWGAPGETYAPVPGTRAPYASATYAAPNYGQAYAQGYSQGQAYPYANPAAYGVPFATPPNTVPPVPPLSPVQNRFPAGAIWLIGLGTIFLLGTTGIFRHVSPGIFVGLLLIGFAVWLFFRLMTDTGFGLSDDGTAGYRLRLLRALKPSVWLLLFGVLSLLNDLRWLRWEYSWPWIVILAGVMMLLNRAAYNSAAAAMYGSSSPATVPPTTTAEASAATPVVTPAEHTEADLPQGGN